MSTVESQHHFNNRPVIVVMGSSGCGKSTIAQALSTHLSLPFIEGDDVHPASNVDKMSKGIALTDDDRWPWFDLLSKAMAKHISHTGGVVIACSALKRSYRDYLATTVNTAVMFAYINVPRELLLQRMQDRGQHYMPTSLLDSQLATLEAPAPDEFSIDIDGQQSIDEIVESILTSTKEISSN